MHLYMHRVRGVRLSRVREVNVPDSGTCWAADIQIQCDGNDLSTVITLVFDRKPDATAVGKLFNFEPSDPAQQELFAEALA